MTIWYVNCMDLSCAWTKKEDAIKYVKEEAENCGWELIATEGREDNEHDFVDYLFKYENQTFEINVIPTWLDEKPYISINE